MSSSGVLMRTGWGTHTSANGVTYTGAWLEDKVCVIYDFYFLLITIILLFLTICFEPFAVAWQRNAAASLRSTL